MYIQDQHINLFISRPNDKGVQKEGVTPIHLSATKSMKKISLQVPLKIEKSQLSEKDVNHFVGNIQDIMSRFRHRISSDKVQRILIGKRSPQVREMELKQIQFYMQEQNQEARVKENMSYEPFLKVREAIQLSKKMQTPNSVSSSL